ncbi:tRNA lysidine(34) synthetase TilS [Hyphobacterium sp. CCMP332]|nr:tRNA lysidine(34) synthetase TilS [Hyphobacterium sp. CCMP332]
MLEHFSNLLKERYRLKKKNRLLLAVSGGIDSVVLCDLISKTDYDFAIAHVNFLLREEDSEKDEHFVKDLSKRFEVPFYSHRENAGIKADEWKMSVQMAARKIRYEFFEQVMDSFNYDYLLTAHHLEDSFETAILNFIKSGTYSSISGIPDINNNIIRPLISFSKKDIEEYASKTGLNWREDKSNSSLYYQRNIVRHKIVPVAEEINPSYLKTFSDASNQMHLLRFFLESKLKEAKSDWIQEKKDSISVNISRLKNNPEELFIFWEYIKCLKFNFNQFHDMVKSLNSESGKTFYAEDYMCVKDRTNFIITLKNKISEELIIEKPEDLNHLENSSIKANHLKKDFTIEKDKNVAILDAALITYPLKLRPWQEGDKFQPLGMKGEKKISDFLIDLKVPLNFKKNQYVLLSGEDIVWVVGQRISEKYRITDNTKQALRLEIL